MTPEQTLQLLTHPVVLAVPVLLVSAVVTWFTRNRLLALGFDEIERHGIRWTSVLAWLVGSNVLLVGLAIVFFESGQAAIAALLATVVGVLLRLLVGVVIAAAGSWFATSVERDEGSANEAWWIRAGTAVLCGLSLAQASLTSFLLFVGVIGGAVWLYRNSHHLAWLREKGKNIGAGDLLRKRLDRDASFVWSGQDVQLIGEAGMFYSALLTPDGLLEVENRELLPVVVGLPDRSRD